MKGSFSKIKQDPQRSFSDACSESLGRGTFSFLLGRRCPLCIRGLRNPSFGETLVNGSYRERLELDIEALRYWRTSATSIRFGR